MKTTTKTILKISSIIIALILIIILIISSKNKVFIPESLILDSGEFEIMTEENFISCQIDCTLNDGIFHEECLGFNGCEGTDYYKDKAYCEQDLDCVTDLGCCLNICDDNIETCHNIRYCQTSNKQYVDAHKFSCEMNGITCTLSSECREMNNAKCVHNKCRIID